MPFCACLRMNDVLVQQPKRILARKFAQIGMKRKCSSENENKQRPEEGSKLGRFEHSKEKRKTNGKAKGFACIFAV